MSHQVFVIGGAAVDIKGWPDAISRLRDSNLGKVRISAGGVGKNIANMLADTGARVELVTAVGMGYHAEVIRADCAAHGVSLAHTLTLAEHTGTYLSVLDDEGDLLIGINDMSILERITPECCRALLPRLNAANMVVLDGNLSPDTLAFVTQNVTAPIFYDPVSCAKATRIGDNIGRCYAIKPNRYEATFLSGRSCDTVRGVYRAADWFLEQGVKRVFVSLGAEGIFFADETSNGVLSAACHHVVDTTSAGDVMSAAIIKGCLDQMSTEACACAGNAASAALCEGKRAEERA